MSAGSLIFRAMEEENGLPKLGQTATALGVRFGRDIVIDPAGLVHRPSFLPGQSNGLSCSPTVQSLPAFVLPLSLGGQNKKTVVWSIDIQDLGSDLVAQDDSRSSALRHVSIGPTRRMTADEFEKAITATRPKWKRVSAMGP